jgi:predicted dehydrogenase
MDGGCYALDCLRLLGPGEPSVTAALADPWSMSREPSGAVADRATAVRLAFPDEATGWFESAFTRDGEFRADVHVSCEHGTVWVQDFIRAHWGHLVAVRHGSVVADERGGGDTTYTEQLRAFAGAVVTGATVPTSAPLSTAEHAVTTMRLIDDAYAAAGLLPRGA